MNETSTPLSEARAAITSAPSEDDLMPDDLKPLPSWTRLAIIDCLLDGRASEATDRLWREDPGQVRSLADRIALTRFLDMRNDLDGRHGLHAERLRELRRPHARANRRGMTLNAIAAEAGIERHTLACLMEHHGYLELVPYGGHQRRRLATDRAIAAGLGINVDASGKRIAHLEGAHRAATFPVFFAEHVPAIL